MCQECSARQRRIEEKLKQKKSIRCTCTGQQHSYSNEKCKLYQRKAGENIWPGQNNEVSEDDWHFAERMRKRNKINRFLMWEPLGKQTKNGVPAETWA